MEQTRTSQQRTGWAVVIALCAITVVLAALGVDPTEQVVELLR